MIFVVLLLFFYFIPTFLAAFKRKKNGFAIFLANFVFGWTIFGWIVVLIWSATND